MDLSILYKRFSKQKLNSLELIRSPFVYSSLLLQYW